MVQKFLAPNHQRWYAKWKLSRNMYTMHTRFRTFGTDFQAQSELIDKKFLHRSSVGNLLRVHCWLGRRSWRRRSLSEWLTDWLTPMKDLEMVAALASKKKNERKRIMFFFFFKDVGNKRSCGHSDSGSPPHPFFFKPPLHPAIISRSSIFGRGGKGRGGRGNTFNISHGDWASTYLPIYGTF